MIDVTPLGTILKGKYQITELIKRGGMGAVFKVRELSSGKIWALKELLDLDTDVNERENNLKMFQEEARMLATLSHSNIPQVVAYFAEQDRHYLVMDFITGENLEEKLNKALQKNETLPLKQVLEWAGQVCRVLDYLHNHKPTPIIFRDLKPANIMVTGEGVVKLIDFGIARTYKIGKRKDTFIFGTINYASPEHRGSSQTDHRSDIYTLGATLYHLLTGYPPVPFHTPVPGSLVKKNPKLPYQVEMFIIKSMAQDKMERYQSASEMFAAIQALSGQTPVIQVVPPPTAPVFSVLPAPEPVYGESDVKYCDRCGTSNRKTAKYCCKCRYILKGGSPKPQEPPVLRTDPSVMPAPSVPQGAKSGTFYEQGMKYFKEGIFTKAGQEFQKAIQLDTRNSRANFMMGRVYFELADYPQALNFFHRALELELNNHEFIMYIGRANLERKDYASAERTFLKIIQLNPASDEAFRWLGKTCLGRKDGKSAIEHFEKAIALNHMNILAYFDLFYACRELAYYHKGMEVCKRAVSIDPGNPEVYVCLGIACCDITDYKDALKYLKKALTMNPNHWKACYHAGIVYRYLGKDSDSITEFKKALTLHPDDPLIYRELAVSYSKLGSISRARDVLKEAIRLDPHNPENRQIMDSLRGS
ncbi:MAG: tetratricopeptide repeat protein [Candidatus Eremiobacterota bacterium]